MVPFQGGPEEPEIGGLVLRPPPPVETGPIAAIADVPTVYLQVDHRDVGLAGTHKDHLRGRPGRQGPASLFHHRPRKHVMEPAAFVADVDQVLDGRQALGGLRGQAAFLEQPLDGRVLEVAFKQLLPWHACVAGVQAKGAPPGCDRVGQFQDAVGIFGYWHKRLARRRQTALTVTRIGPCSKDTLPHPLRLGVLIISYSSGIWHPAAGQ